MTSQLFLFAPFLLWLCKGTWQNKELITEKRKRTWLSWQLFFWCYILHIEAQRAKRNSFSNWYYLTLYSPAGTTIGVNSRAQSKKETKKWNTKEINKKKTKYRGQGWKMKQKIRKKWGKWYQKRKLFVRVACMTFVTMLHSRLCDDE